MAKPMKFDVHTGCFANVYTHWQKKLMGSMPSAELICLAQHLAASRAGTKHALAVAMMCRPNEGASDSQVWFATELVRVAGGTPQVLHTHRDSVCNLGWFDRVTTKREATPQFKNESHTQLTLLPKGESEYKRRKAAGICDEAARKFSTKILAEHAAAIAAAKAAAAAKAKLTREAKKAAKLAATQATPFENTVTMPHTIDEAMAVNGDTDN